ncbi:MAG: 16S rRNA (adenine(1518)-N(6)/adenine(1519)-N(6))-dimethyltransferase RsmA [Maricaulaceae bacterium]
MENLPTLTEVVRLHGLAANKKLGQHFLLDMNVTDKIARLVTPAPNETIIEVGPGPGGLTRSLFKTGAENVVAVEMDERFLPALQDIGDAADGTLTVINGDAVKIDWHAIIPNPINGDVKIAANLPYNVGTKILINWLTSDPLFWSRAVLMFQKEVAERIAAQPGDKAYGRLAILSQSICDVDLSFVVPAKAFTPPPKVDSAVVFMEVKPPARRYAHLKTLGEVTQAAFGQRRKMLRRSLKSFAEKQGLNAEDWCASCDINPQNRPEELPVDAFQKLTNYLIQNQTA